MDFLKESVRKTIDKYSMLSPGERVIVGLSGGADSVSLAYILHKMGYDIVCVHINHMIRGNEALRDEEFVAKFCKQFNIPLKIFRKNIPSIAKEEGISEELAGRKIRYQCFDECMKEFSANKIAVAHNMNDNLETMIFNLARGTGMKGICGIPPVNGCIIRPLIDVQRCEIEAFLKRNGLDYVTDSTNNENIYSRNIIRNLILPHFESLNSSYVKNARRCSEIVREEDEFIEKISREYFEKNCFEDGQFIKIKLMSECEKVILRRVIHLCCNIKSGSDVNLSYDNINDILSLKTGKVFCTDKISIRREYDYLVIGNTIKEKLDYSYPFSVNDNIFINETGEIIKAEMIKDVSKADFSEKNTSYVDADKLYNPTIRNRREGDRFVPTGMNKEKKLKEFFIDSKIPVRIRNSVPILCSDGKIAAIVGIRTDENFKIDKNTKNVLKITRSMCDEI